MTGHVCATMDVPWGAGDLSLSCEGSVCGGAWFGIGQVLRPADECSSHMWVPTAEKSVGLQDRKRADSYVFWAKSSQSFLRLGVVGEPLVVHSCPLCQALATSYNV